MKRPRKGDRRRGSAIILVLGVLALLLIITMVFLFKATTGNQLADYKAAATRARLLNESGLLNALGMLKTMAEPRDATPGNYLDPGRFFILKQGSSSTWALGSDTGKGCMPSMRSSNQITDGLGDALIAKLVGPGGGLVNYSYLSPSASDTSLDANESWIPIYSTVNYGNGPSNEIIGAYAYVIIDATGLLDPSRISLRSTVRQGLSLAEIGFESIVGTDSPEYEGLFNAPHLSVADMFSVPTVNADSTIIKYALFPGTRSERDQLWVDLDSDSVAQPGELYSRISLSNLGSIQPNSLFEFLISAGVRSAHEAANDSLVASPWVQLLNKGDILEDTETLYRHAAQLTLNMLDYADSDMDTRPRMAYLRYDSSTVDCLFTSNEDLVNDSVTNSDFVLYGAEQYPYLSQLLIEFYAERQSDSKAYTTLKLQPQIANPFGHTIHDTRTEVSITYNYTLDIGGRLVTQANKTSTWGQSEVDSSISSNIVKTFHAGTVADSAVVGANLVTDNISLSSLTITAIHVKGNMTNTNYDTEVQNFLYPMNALGKINTEFASFFSSDTTLTDTIMFSCVVKAKDPTFVGCDLSESPTHREKFWSFLNCSDAIIPIQLQSDSVSFGAVTTLADHEYSEVKCENSPPFNLGELGRIHSPAYPNQSLRLWVDDPNNDGSWTDAGLLDMFTTESMSHKININTGNGYTIQGLIHGCFGGAKDGSAKSNLYWANGHTAGGSLPLYRRSEIYKIFNRNGPGGSLYNPSTEDRDAEEALGKFIELTSTRQNYFVIITTSRALKYLGAAPDYVKRKSNYMDLGGGNGAEVEAEYKTLAVVYRDAWTGEIKVLRKDVIYD